jgi:hypothetical protein
MLRAYAKYRLKLEKEKDIQRFVQLAEKNPDMPLRSVGALFRASK